MIGDHYLDAELRGAATHGLERLRWLAGQDGIDPTGPAGHRSSAPTGSRAGTGRGAVGYVALADALAAEAADAASPARGSSSSRAASRPGRLGWFAERVAAEGLLCLLTATSPARIAHPTAARRCSRRARSAWRCRAGRRRSSTCRWAASRSETSSRPPRPTSGSRPGAGVRPDGSPEDDPAEILADRAGIRPFGGDQAHKGFALAVLVELLVAAVSSSPGFAAVALLAAPASDAAGRVCASCRQRAGSRATRAGPGATPRWRAGRSTVPDDLWAWIRR